MHVSCGAAWSKDSQRLSTSQVPQLPRAPLRVASAPPPLQVRWFSTRLSMALQAVHLIRMLTSTSRSICCVVGCQDEFSSA